MSEERVWNDESREDLRQTLRWVILGALRLGKRDHADILQTCNDAYIPDDCPEQEREEFVQFADAEFKRILNQLKAEMATWPDETDCDRLDRVESKLRDRGIMLWQASPCCDTCTGAELGDRIKVIDERYPGFRERLRGYAFFIDQKLPEDLADSTQLSVYLGYGWFAPDDSEATASVYNQRALAIAHEVCDCLRDEGLEVDWDGKLSRKIGVSLNWQRRTLLE